MDALTAVSAVAYYTWNYPDVLLSASVAVWAAILLLRNRT
jgi:hypothetical protein